MSSHNTKNSNEGVNMRRVIEPPDPNAYLLERILSESNMQQAWKRVKANNLNLAPKMEYFIESLICCPFRD